MNCDFKPQVNVLGIFGSYDYNVWVEFDIFLENVDVVDCSCCVVVFFYD